MSITPAQNLMNFFASIGVLEDERVNKYVRITWLRQEQALYPCYVPDPDRS
jgi:hypothetical protein